MLFLVENIDSTQRRSYGLYDEETMSSLLKHLSNHRIIPLSIHKLPSIFAPFLPAARTKVSPDEVIELIESLHLVIKSGLPLHSGLLDLAEDADNPKFKKMLIMVAEEINSGKSLSAAFKPYEKALGAMLINLIRIGEETGQLQVTLERGAQFLKRTLALKKKAKQALIYPSFAFATVSAAMLVWMLYVLPQMTDLFKQMKVELPPLTLFLMAASEFLTNYIGYMAVGLVALIIAFKVLHKKYQKVRFHTDRYILKIPIIKHIVSGFNMAFIAEYLRLAIVSGVPLFNALDILKNNLQNEVFQKALISTHQDVSRGLQLSESFKKTGLFTPFMIRMMSVGEASGNLDSQLELIAQHYNEKVDYYAENIGKVIEPVVLIFVGGFMALVMVGLMGPMYDLVGQMGNK
ncbi:MAG: type II secretion system F family protein [Campylobacterales bacterium]|nr:type II secretion system F family protein [Campylobacterales bacterium]